MKKSRYTEEQIAYGPPRSRWSRRADYQEYVRCPSAAATQEIGAGGFIMVAVEQIRNLDVGRSKRRRGPPLRRRAWGRAHLDEIDGDLVRHIRIQRQEPIVPSGWIASINLLARRRRV